MLNNLRAKLRRWLRHGLWFPFLRWLIRVLYENLSLGNWFDVWLRDGYDYARGATELYQLTVLAVGFIWAIFVNKPLITLLTAGPIRSIGLVIASYFVFELFLFSLHWAFVAEGRLHSIRRSLAGFLFNLFVEVPLFFMVIFALADCEANPSSYFRHVYFVFKLEAANVFNTTACQVASSSEIIIAAMLLTIAIASLVGAVIRPAKSP